ncbi:MAG: universal stress protein [Gemmatimonadota bacterium]|nr:universal stress protein [Gemmatimonadota bacterium]
MTGIDKIVAGVDFTGHGMEGTRWAAAHLEPGTIFLVHALHLPKPPSFLRGLWGDEEQIALSARAGATDRLEEFAEQLARETGVTVEARVRTGVPGEQIVEVANSVGAKLVVVGPHSRHRGRWGRLGSTAERAIHHGRVPTLLATGHLREPRRMLAAVDDSAVSAGVLSWLERLARHTGARATAIHVIDNTMEMTYRAILKPNAPDRETGLEKEAGTWLEARLENVGLEDVDATVALGDPALEILAAAERTGADLLIMGTHGAGAATRLLMGGVARAVTRGVHCPVLLLPTPE